MSPKGKSPSAKPAAPKAVAPKAPLAKVPASKVPASKVSASKPLAAKVPGAKAPLLKGKTDSLAKDSLKKSKPAPEALSSKSPKMAMREAPPAREEPRERAPEPSPLKKKELDMFKDLLLEEKRKILRHLEEVSAHSEQQLDTSVASGDAADIASLEMTQANLQKIGKREGYLLKKIDLALEKIVDGTYGECEMCGEAISPARLKARPVAQLCIDCKTAQESEERRFSTRDRSDDGDGEISEETEEG